MKPELIIALGATAAKALLGTDFRVSVQRGKPQALMPGLTVIATVHPSAVLRAPSGERARAEREFVRDVAKALERL